MSQSSASPTRSTHTSWARAESSISSSVASADTVRRRISRRLRRRTGMPVWCGGMLEVGHRARAQHRPLHAPGFTLPGDVSASERYWEEDIIEPPVTVSRAGTITAPTGHGIGFEVNEDFVESLTVRRDDIRLALPGTGQRESSRLNVSQLRLLSALLCVLLPAVAAAEETRLLRRPTVSRDMVVFAYASDLWAVRRTGGQARRLTATPFVETDPAPLAGWFTDRVYRDGRRKHRRLRDAGVGRRAGAADVSPRDRRGTWLESGRPTGAHRVDPDRRAVTQRQPIFPVVDDSARRHSTASNRRSRTAGAAANAPRVHRHLLARWPAHGLRRHLGRAGRRLGAGAEQPVAALPRRAHASRFA